MFSHLLKKSRSKPLLRADSEQSQDLYLSNANVPAYASGSVPFLRGPRPPSPTFLSRKEIGRTKKKSTNGRPPPLPPKDPPIILIEPMFSLDTDLTRMDGIVDSTVLKSIHQEAGSPGSGFESFQSSGLSQSDSGQAGLSSSPTTSIFSNPYPFFSSTSPSKRKPHSNHEHRKIDPKTILDLSTTNVSLESHPDAPSWEPPESWSVEKEGVALGEPDSSSSECSIVGRPTSMVLNAQRKKVRRKTAVKPLKTPSGYSSYKIRIYRTNNTFHVASIGLTVTVSELTPVLNQKLLTDGERETHRLYLKERGRGKQ
jgi:adenylate cyclase